MTRIVGFFISILLLGVCHHAVAQSDTLTLTGTVLDSLTHLPLSTVTVVNQTANTITNTDESGKFMIHCSAGDSLFFTLLGYAHKRELFQAQLHR